MLSIRRCDSYINQYKIRLIIETRQGTASPQPRLPFSAFLPVLYLENLGIVSHILQVSREELGAAYSLLYHMIVGELEGRGTVVSCQITRWMSSLHGTVS